MYTLTRQISAQNLLWMQTPAFVMSFAIASFFYKFGSFALECVAFLATWFLIDFVMTKLRQHLLEGRSPSTSTR